MDQEKIGKLIKKIRQESGYTQEKFASIYGVTYQAVSKWENGKSLPDISILKKICEEYNYDLNSLLSGTDISENRKVRNRKKIIVVVGATFLLLGLAFFAIKHFDDNDDFNFKTLSASCDDFELYGSMAYNDNKTSIYISNITYCGEETHKEYGKIDCILYEKNENTKTKISSFSYSKDENITLEAFLKDINFNVDNYSQTCKNYKDNGLVLEILATLENENTDFFEIPLKLEDNCN